MKVVDTMLTFVYGLLILSSVLWLASCQLHAQELDLKPYAAMIAANVADLWTTQAAFARGAHEANPVMAPLPFPRMVVAKSAAVAGVAVVMQVLATHGHPRLAKIIGYVDAGAIGAVAVSNARTSR